MDILDVDLYQFELVYRDCFRKVVQKKEKGVELFVLTPCISESNIKFLNISSLVPPDAYSTGLSYIPSFFELRCKGTYLWGFCKFSSSFFVLIMSFFLLICVTCCFVVDYQLLWCWLLFVFVYIQSTLIF